MSKPPLAFTLRGSPMTIDPRVAASLAMVAEALRTARDPWWIIGSAAVELCGGDAGGVADIDVLVSRYDIEALCTQLPLTDTPEEGKAMFRSVRFGRWAEPPLDVEFMHGLEVDVRGEWRRLEPRTRQAIKWGKHALFVPDRPEMVAILKLFGREKDLRRAATLERLIKQPD